MLISHSKKFIFIHNYKVAGTSIRQSLLDSGDFNWKSKNPIKLLSYATGRYPMFFSNSLPAHSSAYEIKKHLGKWYSRYYSFAFVRNPWDWQVSLYKFMLRDKSHHQHELIAGMNSFDDYILKVQNEQWFQKDFICDNDANVIVDFIRRLENLQSDYNKICDIIGIKRREIPHLNKSKSQSYREYYFPFSRNLIAKHFKKDIDFFGYYF